MSNRHATQALVCGVVLGWALGLTGAYLSLCVFGSADWPDGTAR